jgi:hypothetical protein
MNEPVLSAEGISYDKACITDYIKEHNTLPDGNNKDTILYDNRLIKDVIDFYKNKYL